MSERVLKVLNDEVERLTKQNDTLTRDINFYFERIDTYQKARNDNRDILREVQAEIITLVHRKSDRLDKEALAKAGEMVFKNYIAQQNSQDIIETPVEPPPLQPLTCDEEVPF